MQFENPSKTLFVPLAHVHSIVLVVKLARQSNIKWWEQNGILIPFTSINPDFAEELGNALTGGIFTGSFHECIIPYEDELSCTSKLNEERIRREMQTKLHKRR
ncbi:MAG: hypothetical protein P8016_15815 [Sedimentisphaerales bacterium]